MKEWISMGEILRLFRVDDPKIVTSLVEQGHVRRGPDLRIGGRPPIWTYSLADLSKHLSGREKKGLKLDGSDIMMVAVGAGATAVTELAVSPMFQSIVEIVRGYVATMENQNSDGNWLTIEQSAHLENCTDVDSSEFSIADAKDFQMMLKTPLEDLTKFQREKITNFAINKNLVKLDNQGRFQDAAPGSGFNAGPASNHQDYGFGSGVDAVSKWKIDKL